MKKIQKPQGGSVDLVLGVMFALIAIGFGWFGHTTQIIDHAWLRVGGLLLLEATCLRWNKVGWKSQFTWFGRRTQYIAGEGIHIVAWIFGFGHLPEDCRTKLHKLDPLRVLTMDNILVEVKDGALLQKIVDLNKYHNLDTKNPKALEEYLDAFWAQIIRGWVSGLEYSNLKKEEIRERTQERAGEPLEWGIEVSDVNIPEIIAVNPEVQAAF